MSNDSDDPGHGDSPAAWTAVVIMLVAFSVGTIAFFFDVQIVVWISAVVVVVGWIVGGVLARMGYGVGGAKVIKKDAAVVTKEY